MEMKQSQIAEAIEEGKSTTNNVYKIYGYSDDMLTVEGPDIEEEFYFDPDGVDPRFIKIYASSDGLTAAIKGAIVGSGQWVIGVNPIHDDALLPIGSYELSAKGYTAVLTITTPKRLTFTGHQGDQN